MRQRVLVCGSILLGLGFLFIAGFYLLRPRPRIDQATLDRIQIGMAESEVIEIVGAPPGDYGVGRYEMDVTGSMLFPMPVDANEQRWVGQEKAIVISLDADGKVNRKRLADVWREYDSQFDMLCRLARLKDRKEPPWHFVW